MSDKCWQGQVAERGELPAGLVERIWRSCPVGWSVPRCPRMGCDDLNSSIYHLVPPPLGLKNSTRLLTAARDSAAKQRAEFIWAIRYPSLNTTLPRIAPSKGRPERQLENGTKSFLFPPRLPFKLRGAPGESCPSSARLPRLHPDSVAPGAGSLSPSILVSAWLWAPCVFGKLTCSSVK